MAARRQCLLGLGTRCRRSLDLRHRAGRRRPCRHLVRGPVRRNRTRRDGPGPQPFRLVGLWPASVLRRARAGEHRPVADHRGHEDPGVDGWSRSADDRPLRRTPIRRSPPTAGASSSAHRARRPGSGCSPSMRQRAGSPAPASLSPPARPVNRMPMRSTTAASWCSGRRAARSSRCGSDGRRRAGAAARRGG